MSRKKKLINNSDLPDHEIEAIARCIYRVCRMEGKKGSGGKEK